VNGGARCNKAAALNQPVSCLTLCLAPTRPLRVFSPPTPRALGGGSEWLLRVATGVGSADDDASAGALPDGAVTRKVGSITGHLLLLHLYRLLHCEWLLQSSWAPPRVATLARAAAGEPTSCFGTLAVGLC
jgi:hypothetical protein